MISVGFIRSRLWERRNGLQNGGLDTQCPVTMKDYWEQDLIYDEESLYRYSPMDPFYRRGGIFSMSHRQCGKDSGALTVWCDEEENRLRLFRRGFPRRWILRETGFPCSHWLIGIVLKRGTDLRRHQRRSWTRYALWDLWRESAFV